MRHVHMNRRVLRQWLKSGVCESGQLHRTEMGTPQGGIISPTLANITLNGLESSLARYLAAELGAKPAERQKVNVVRYADDFVVTGNSKELLETVVKPWVVQFLRERGLVLNEDKTRIVHIDQGFDFLGWNFRKYRGKMLIKPSRKNVKAFYSKVRDIIGDSLSEPTERLIQRLNPILRGWATYHRGVVAKETFSTLDHLIYWRLMRWGRRRHPRKTRSWIYNHYWLGTGTRKDFAGKASTREGGEVGVTLYRLADTKIVRHQKIKAAYNPFDPAWLVYGETLRVSRMSENVRNEQRLTLWLEQDGKCALCQSSMDSDETMDDHHIVYRTHGGSHALSNRVLLHPVCHRRVHALGLEVAKPVPARGL